MTRRAKKHDPVNHPKHYTDPSGVECIDIVEHRSFNIGNAMKYLFRAGRKGDLIEDLKKAKWYVAREIARLEKTKEQTTKTKRKRPAAKAKARRR